MSEVSASKLSGDDAHFVMEGGISATISGEITLTNNSTMYSYGGAVSASSLSIDSGSVADLPMFTVSGGDIVVTDGATLKVNALSAANEKLSVHNNAIVRLGNNGGTSEISDAEVAWGVQIVGSQLSFSGANAQSTILNAHDAGMVNLTGSGSTAALPIQVNNLSRLNLESGNGQLFDSQGMQCSGG